MSDDWRDPFSEDERAAERERRRAERAAKRRDRQSGTRKSLGERVRDQLSGSTGEGEAVPAPEKPSATPEQAAAAEKPAEQEAPAGPDKPDMPASQPPPPPEQPAVQDPPAAPKTPPAPDPPAAPATSERPAVPPPAAPETAEHQAAAGQTGEHHAGEITGETGETDFFDTEAADFFEIEDQPLATPPTTSERLEAARARKVRRRRFALLAFVILLVAAVGAGGYFYKHRNDDAPPPAPPPKPRKTFDVTIPEGYTRAQMATVAKKAGLKGDYLKASKRSKAIDLSKYGAKNAKNLEGFLFPATYELFKGASAQDLVDKQVEAFKQNFDPISQKYAESKNLDPYDVVIIASMIEREIQVAKERKLAASVIYNRLADGTPLGIDATIRYEDNNFTKPLLESRLEEDTPYNTRINTGLPPGPIGNPGVSSLEAASNPAKTDYFFYVVKPGTCGEHTFVKTQAEFDQATAAYNNARDAAGGKSPTTC
jgi:hypothetical protein